MNDAIAQLQTSFFLKPYQTKHENIKQKKKTGHERNTRIHAVKPVESSSNDVRCTIDK